MQILNVTQGSAEWLAIRSKYRPASEAPVMMGASSKMSRRELVRMYATGDERDFSDWVQKNLLDKGHEIEAAARAIAEQIVGEELFPIVCTDDEGYLMASLDGATLLGDVIWECKSWNESKASYVRDGAIPAEDAWQVIHQIVVTAAEKCLYMVTDGTPEKTMTLWVKPKEFEISNLRKGWRQFDDDVSNYEHVEVLEAPAGKAPGTLPALRIELTGAVTASNLTEFRDTAMAVIGAVNAELKTDQDFADAEKAVKWCADVEKRLEAAKDHALSQTATIDELFRTIDEIKEEARQKRLTLDKLVKSRKETIRAEIVQGGQSALAKHVAALNARIGKPWMSAIPADFAGAAKGKKTVASLHDAVDAELAHAKIAANEMADLIQANIATLEQIGGEHQFLFADARQFIIKPADDVAALIKARISDWKEEEQKRAEREAKAKVDAEERRRQREEEEAQRRVAITEKPKQEAQEPVNHVNDSTAERSMRVDSEPAAKQHWHYLYITFQSDANEAGAEHAVIQALTNAGIVAKVKHITMEDEA